MACAFRLSAEGGMLLLWLAFDGRSKRDNCFRNLMISASSDAFSFSSDKTRSLNYLLRNKTTLTTSSISITFSSMPQRYGQKSCQQRKNQ
jgi:hypothetical protein